MANRRQGIGDGRRFEIFQRDGFQCQYCGGKPPEVVLVIDHIRSVAEGGTNDAINLVTSCRDCNSGKSDKKLHSLPPSIDEVISQQAETIAQLTAYNEFLRQSHKLELESVDDVVAYFESNAAIKLQPQDIASIKQFFRRLGYREMIDAVDAAVARYGDGNANRLWRYFCGVCWNKVKGTEPPDNAA